MGYPHPPLVQRHVAVPNLSGFVVAKRQPDSSRLWMGDGLERRRQRRRPRLHELCFRALREPPAQPIAVETEEEGGDIASDVGDESMPDVNVSESEGEQEEPEEYEQDSDHANSSSSASSTSTTSNSSSGASSKSSSSSSSSTSSDGDNDGSALNDVAVPAETSQTHSAISRAVQSGTHSYGPFRITFRKGTPSQKAGWQATCLFHAKYGRDGKIQTRCTRSVTLGAAAVDSDESKACLRALYTWLLSGAETESKTAHQALQIESLDDDTLDAALTVLQVPEDPVGEEEPVAPEAKRQARTKRKRDLEEDES